MPYSHSHQEGSGLARVSLWVFLAATVLAANAGYINSIMLASFQMAVSHVSGSVSRLGIDLVAYQVVDFKLIFSNLLGFLLGAMLCGLLIRGTKLKPDAYYSVVLILEASLLGLATFLIRQKSFFAIPCASMACGLQNAMASSYYGLILRTTHMTGIMTDIGVLLGHWIRNRKIVGWKLLLLLSILNGFFLGGVLGAWVFHRHGLVALSYAAFACLLMSVLYFYWQKAKRASLKQF